jgi:hypothetical protein
VGRVRNMAAVLVILWSCLASGQSAGQMPATQGRSTQGQLTVTVTVVASVGLVTGPDGIQRIVMANSSDPADNVSRLSPIVLSNSVSDKQSSKKTRKQK